MFLPRIPLLFVRFFPCLRGTLGRQFAAHFVAAAIVSLAPSLLFGALFPAAVGSLGSAEARFGRTIGTAYVANTMGTVAGAFVAGVGPLPPHGPRAPQNFCGAAPRHAGA